MKQQTEGHTPTSDTLLPTIVVSNESSSDNITGRESEIVKISKSKSKHPIHGERGEPEKQEVQNVNTTKFCPGSYKKFKFQ